MDIGFVIISWFTNWLYLYCV